MKVSFVANKPAASGCAVILVKKPFKAGGGSTSYLSATKGEFKLTAKAANFDGEEGKTFSVFAPSGSKISRLVVWGIGDSKKIDPEMLGAKIAKALMMSEKTITLHLGNLKIEPDAVARAAVGMRLAAYRFDKYRTKLPASKKPVLKTIKIACDEPSKARAAYTNFHGPVCDGTLLARDLVNEPPNVLFPKAYAARIRKLKELGLDVEVLGEKRMKTLGMNALLCVGQGSERESQMVIMRWAGGKKSERPICLIGKGVTFDAGGISLKPSANMWDMKGDMGGSAAVVGAMSALAARKAKANVIGIVGLVENMPDGKAVLPGDIITSMSGQTIEVQNTDAEGRLVLADCLHYASTKLNPVAMIDLATLTGAVIGALGNEYAGLFSNDEKLAAQILTASITSTEKMWRLPMGPEYDKQIDSPNADMKNIGGKAGAITAAQFLKRFVGKNITWAHCDIAGTGMKPSGRTDPRETTFGTGFGARLLNQWIADNFERKT